MKLVYIAGPFSPTSKQREGGYEASVYIRDNIVAATNLAVRVAASGDYLPVCPHTNTGDPRFLDLHDTAWWYAATLELMSRCDAIALTDDWEESNGACREVIEASELGMMLWADGHCGYRLGSWAHDRLRTQAVAALRSRGETP